MSQEANDQQSVNARRWRIWTLVVQMAALSAGLLLTVPTEVARFRLACESKLGASAWFFWAHPDTTYPFLLLVIVPLVWLIRARTPRPAAVAGTAKLPGEGPPPGPAARRGTGPAWAMALGCLATSLAATGWIASTEIVVEEGKPAMRFGDLPPAIHDEFSYLFQAETFLAGKLSFPSSPRMPELFDQMHVLNEGRFASRYFPGVGMWLAPFLAMGHPYWGEALAAGLASFFVFWAARELAGNKVGLAAGLLTAASPGMGLFSNMLLSHEPTMAALACFLFFFLRLMRTDRPSDALLAGCGLCFAMLCRPLTAAGFALPFGLWFAARLARDLIARRVEKIPNSSATRPRRFRSAFALAAPLVLGLAGLFFYDRAITGSGFVTPYQLYTDIYTPRHVYGFNNVVRGERRLGPKVLDNYDRWAENLTPRLAIENVGKRFAASARWTLGPVPLAMAGVFFLLAAVWKIDRRWMLVAASVLSLHAVYVPYWLAGIMDWHYVFESGPLLLMIFAAASQQLIGAWRESRRIAMPAWWGALVLSAVVTNWLPFDPFWLSRVEGGVEELAFSRLRYERVGQLFDRAVSKRPALILIEPDPTDRHIDYVYNTPALNAPLLRGRYNPAKNNLEQVHRAFPDRALYLFRARTGQLSCLAGCE